MGCRGGALDDDGATASPTTDPTLVALVERITDRRPQFCEAIRDLTGRAAYEAIVRLIAEGVDATPSPVADDFDADRAGDLFVNACEERTSSSGT
jgi:hypothetical protein